MKKLLIALIPLSLLACTSQQPVSRVSVSPVASGTAATEGIYYFLPKTAIQVEVTAEKTIEKRGPFYRYSQRYLNLSDVITEDRETWEIRSARVTTTGRPDTDRRYRITAEGTPAGAAVSLTPGGILRGLNLFMQPALETTQPQPSAHQLAPTPPVNFDDVPYTGEQLLKTSTAAMAEEVANEIYRLRENRTRILESNAQLLPPDEGSYNTVLKKMDHQEEQFLSLFRGKKESHTLTKSFTFVPDSAIQGNQVLFRFSEQNGFLEALDMSGTPVYIDVKLEAKPATGSTLLPEGKEETPRGLVYCVPTPATVKVIDRTLLLTESKVELAQYGKLHRLPASVVNHPGTIVIFNPATGALLQIISGAGTPQKN